MPAPCWCRHVKKHFTSFDYATCGLTSGVAVLDLQCAMAYVTCCAAAMVCTSAVRVFITGSHGFWPMPTGVFSLVSHHFISHLQQIGRDDLREVGRQRLLCGRDSAGTSHNAVQQT